MTTTYVRSSGGHVAERERPAEGSDRDWELAKLAEDPASGWRVEGGPVVETKQPEPASDERPAKNGSHEAWVAYAVTQGVDEDEAAGLKRDELVALFEDGGTPDGGDQ